MGKEEVEAAIAAVEKTVRTIDTWILWCTLLVALGVAGELALGIAHWIKDRELRPFRVLQSQLHEKELLELTLKAALLVDAQKAATQAGRSNAVSTQLQASWTQQMALKLGMIKPSEMDQATRSFQIIEKVAPFVGTRFDVVPTSGDIGVETFLRALRSSLNAAGWTELNRLDPIPQQSSGAGGSVLVTINVLVNKDSKPLDAATALASALKAEDIAAEVNTEPTTDASSANVIHILVGPKP